MFWRVETIPWKVLLEEGCAQGRGKKFLNSNCTCVIQPPWLVRELQASKVCNEWSYKFEKRDTFEFEAC